MLKAIAIDVDGTLTDENRRLHLGAVTKIREIESLGVPVILATGNVLCIAEAASVFIGTTGPVIAENGGIVANPRTDEVRYIGDIKKVEKAFQDLAKRYNVRKIKRSELRKTEIAIYRDFEVNELKKALQDFDVSIVDTKFAIHIKDPAVSKGKALEEVAKFLGIQLSEIAAIGDSENDREMLEIAGYSISVGEESLKDVSDYVTRSSFGEGGEEALEFCIKNLILQE
jgi:hypothetical protein